MFKSGPTPTSPSRATLFDLNQLFVCLALVALFFVSLPSVIATYAQDTSIDSEVFVSYNTTQQIISSPIIISEINFAGSYANPCMDCAYDKWIELYNPTIQAVSLDNYSLRFKNSPASNLNLDLSGYSIGAGSYFLIANARSGMVSSLRQANINPQIYSGKVLSVSNVQTQTVQVTLLYNQTEVVDSVYLDSATTQNPLLDPNNNYSLERVGSAWRPAKNVYSPNNYGSPLGISYAPSPDTSPIQEAQQVIAPKYNPTITQIQTVPVQVQNSNISAQPDFEIAQPVQFADKQILKSVPAPIRTTRRLRYSYTEINPNQDSGETKLTNQPQRYTLSQNSASKPAIQYSFNFRDQAVLVSLTVLFFGTRFSRLKDCGQLNEATTILSPRGAYANVLLVG